jgi:hypothetical protein
MYPSTKISSLIHSTPWGLVRFYPNPYGLRGIEGVSIPDKSKSPPIRINPLQSIWIENNRTSPEWEGTGTQLLVKLLTGGTATRCCVRCLQITSLGTDHYSLGRWNKSLFVPALFVSVFLQRWRCRIENKSIFCTMGTVCFPPFFPFSIVGMFVPC